MSQPFLQIVYAHMGTDLETILCYIISLALLTVSYAESSVDEIGNAKPLRPLYFTTKLCWMFGDTCTCQFCTYCIKHTI